MMNTILLDTSFIVALYHSKDKYHSLALTFVQKSEYVSFLPEVALTEIAFLLRRNSGQIAVDYFLSDLQAEGTTLASVNLMDIERARQILTDYASARLDFVDCCLMALSERLNITRICTFDRRDFSIFRPKHCDFLELLP